MGRERQVNYRATCANKMATGQLLLYLCHRDGGNRTTTALLAPPRWRQQDNYGATCSNKMATGQLLLYLCHRDGGNLAHMGLNEPSLLADGKAGGVCNVTSEFQSRKASPCAAQDCRHRLTGLPPSTYSLPPSTYSIRAWSPSRPWHRQKHSGQGYSYQR